MTISTLSGILASAVAASATFTIAYPAGTSAGSFSGGVAHKLIVGQSDLAWPADFTLAFGASVITVTNATSSGWAVGSSFYIDLDQAGEANSVEAVNGVQKYIPLSLVTVDLGAPATADADGVCATQAITAAGGGTIGGALATDGVADLGLTGRNIVAAWTTTAVMYVTGTDVFGNAMVESSGSGTSFAGKKAFKTVTSVSVSVDVTGATVGTGVLLGLPVFLPGGGNVLVQQLDNAAATAGTLVAGLAPATASTALTADVRGTYSPNSAPNGARAFDLICALADPSFNGVAQYSV
jgi:hypothetical protein